MGNVHQDFWYPLRIKCGLTDATGRHRPGFHMPRHVRPHNSLSRMPVKIAVTMNGRRRSLEFSMSRFSSGIAGKSIPARRGPCEASRVPDLGRTPKRLQTVMGHSSITMTFDLYGHLFEDITADRADIAKIEAAVRARLDATRLQHAGQFGS